jgi:hypothetical protein
MSVTLKEQIVRKVWEEPAFKQNLMADPKQAIKEAFGIEIPAGIEVKVVEENAESFYLTLPPKPEELVPNEPKPNGVW